MIYLKATLIENKLESKLLCEGGTEFTQRIDLSRVKNLKKFKANVFSSLYDAEVEANFKRLD